MEFPGGNISQQYFSLCANLFQTRREVCKHFFFLSTVRGREKGVGLPAGAEDDTLTAIVREQRRAHFNIYLTYTRRVSSK